MNCEIDVKQWKEFKVGELFELHRGTSRIMRELEDGDIPLIASARFNSGIAGYYNVPAEYDNAITVSLNGAGCGSTIYHAGTFAITGDAMVLIPKQDITPFAKMYVSTIYDSYFTTNYSYADKCSPEKASQDCIKLPATSDGQPDWEYMDKYMSQIMDEEREYAEKLVTHDFSKHEIEVKEWKEFKMLGNSNLKISMAPD